MSKSRSFADHANPFLRLAPSEVSGEAARRRRGLHGFVRRHAGVLFMLGVIAAMLLYTMVMSVLFDPRLSRGTLFQTDENATLIR